MHGKVHLSISSTAKNLPNMVKVECRSRWIQVTLKANLDLPLDLPDRLGLWRLLEDLVLVFCQLLKFILDVLHVEESELVLGQFLN